MAWLGPLAQAVSQVAMGQALQSCQTQLEGDPRTSPKLTPAVAGRSCPSWAVGLRPQPPVSCHPLLSSLRSTHVDLSTEHLTVWQLASLKRAEEGHSACQRHGSLSLLESHLRSDVPTRLPNLFTRSQSLGPAHTPGEIT